VAGVQDLHSGRPERFLAASEGPRSAPAAVAAAEAPWLPVEGFQAKVARVAPPKVHPEYSGSADPLIAEPAVPEFAGPQSAGIAGLPPTRERPARVNLEKAPNPLASLVRKDLANENSRTAHFV